MAVAVTVVVGVAVLVADGVAVGLSVGVGVAVIVGVAVTTEYARFLIRNCCGANTVVPPCSSCAVRSYLPGTTASMLNVVKEEVWAG